MALSRKNIGQGYRHYSRNRDGGTQPPSSNTSGSLGAKWFPVPGWTAGNYTINGTAASGYYYDLIHRLGRLSVMVQLSDANNGGHVPYDAAIPDAIIPDPTNIIRVWIGYDAGANNIEIGYL